MNVHEITVIKIILNLYVHQCKTSNFKYKESIINVIHFLILLVSPHSPLFFTLSFFNRLLQNYNLKKPESVSYQGQKNDPISIHMSIS